MARDTTVQIRLDDAEVALLDARRGRMTRSEAMRWALEAWQGERTIRASAQPTEGEEL